MVSLKRPKKLFWPTLSAVLFAVLLHGVIAPDGYWSRPEVGESEIDLKIWLDRYQYSYGHPIHTGAITVRGYLDEGNERTEALENLRYREENGTLLNRAQRRTSRSFCGGSYSMVFWRVDEHDRIVEIFYNRVWCFV